MSTTLAASAVPAAQPIWTPPAPAKLIVEDEAALRSSLTDVLSALAEARDVELCAAGRVSVAERERIAASHRHTAAIAATAVARDEAATAMRAFLASSGADRPGSGALSAAVAVEHAAALDVEVIEAALAGLKVEHEAAIAETAKVMREAEALRDRVVLAQACQMAADLNEANEKALELRRTMTELLRALPWNLTRPAGLIESMALKREVFEVSDYSPGVRRWSTLCNDLLHDAQSTVSPLGD